MTSTRRLRLKAFLAAFVSFLVLGIGGTAAAYWTADGRPLAGSAVAASASVTFTGTAALGSSSLLPYKFIGPGTASTPVIAPLTITNTGTSPLTLALTASSTGTLAPKVDLFLWPGAPGCGTSIPAGTTSTPLSSSPIALPAALATAPVSATPLTLCAATRLSTTVSASQGLTSSITLTLTGTVGTSWTATATATAFTQTVWQVGNPTLTSCVQNSIVGLAATVTLKWGGVTGGTSYRVVKADDTVIKNNLTPAGDGSISTTISALDLGLGGLLTPGTVPVRIQAVDAPYGTTSPGTLVNLRYTVALPLISMACPA